jgi:hypothetical protein
MPQRENPTSVWAANRPETRIRGLHEGPRARGSASRQCRPPRRATAVGWRDRLESEPRCSKRSRRFATEPQQIPSARTWI